MSKTKLSPRIVEVLRAMADGATLRCEHNRNYSCGKNGGPSVGVAWQTFSALVYRAFVRPTVPPTNIYVITDAGRAAVAGSGK